MTGAAPEPTSTLHVDDVAAAGAACDHDDSGCITCGDVALEMRVVAIDPDRELALCETDRGERETVEVALVAPVAEGDRVLVHAATAIANVEGGPAPPAAPPGREAEEAADV